MRLRGTRALLGAVVGIAVMLFVTGVAVTHRAAPPSPLRPRHRTPHARPPPQQPQQQPSQRPAPEQLRQGSDAEYREAMATHSRKMSEELEDKIEQSSAVFIDFKEPKSEGWSLPKVPGAEPAPQPPCSPTDFDFTAEKDEACTRYLSHANSTWRLLKPMYAILADARTIKFRAKLAGGVWLIIKLPQYKFMFEPYSEMMAFHCDRILGLYRVPPVAWTLVPANWFRAAAAALMPAFYVQWLERYSLGRKELKHVVKPQTGQWTGADEALWVSAQLWMDGVKPLARTGAGPPDRHSLLLDPGSRHWPPSQGQLGLWRLGELSDLYVYDYVIGNSDRTVHKNAFGVGSCKDEKWHCGQGASEKLRPRFVFVDQGSSFYGMGSPRRSPLTSSKKLGNSTMCRFRRRTAARLRELRGGGLKDSLLKRTPHGVGFWRHARHWQPDGAQKRLDDLCVHIEQCIQRHGAAAVHPFGD